MLKFLAEYQDTWGPLRLFSSLTFCGAMAAGTSLVIGFAIGPWVILRLRELKLAQSLRDESEVGDLAALHANKKDTPTMGGIIIYVSVTVSVLLWAELNTYVLTALMVFTGLALIGFADDYLKIKHNNSKGLSARYKIAGQLLLTIAALLMLLNSPLTHGKMLELWVPFLKDPLMQTMPIPVALLLLFLVVGGSSNAINLTDGVDGLAIGCTVTVVFVYGIMAYAADHRIIADHLLISHVPGTGELAVICASILGGSLAFLWFNCHPAEVFMGDTGSLALGGLIGAIAFMVHQPITLIIVGGIFVIEAISVILQVGSYKLRGKRIFRMAPIHHHFELRGWHENKVIIRFWIISLVFAIAGLSTLKLR